MVKLLIPVGGICMQGTDEIASIGFCIGASMAGLNILTATSGPGISLYREQIPFAIGSAIFLVIGDVQRLSLSTKSATKSADGDILFLRWGNSGGLPVIVLASVDVADCLMLTVHAFNLVETYRCPVMIASNKENGMTRETADWDAITFPPVVDRFRERRLCRRSKRQRPGAVGRIESGASGLFANPSRFMNACDCTISFDTERELSIRCIVFPQKP